MNIKTWNNCVWGFAFAQLIACILIIALSNSVTASAAALIWMAIGCPCMFGFLINE